MKATPTTTARRPWLNHQDFATEQEAETFANQLIGGGIIQEQAGRWHVFGAREFAERAATMENPA